MTNANLLYDSESLQKALSKSIAPILESVNQFTQTIEIAENKAFRETIASYQSLLSRISGDAKIANRLVQDYSRQVAVLDTFNPSCYLEIMGAEKI